MQTSWSEEAESLLSQLRAGETVSRERLRVVLTAALTASDLRVRCLVRVMANQQRRVARTLLGDLQEANTLMLTRDEICTRSGASSWHVTCALDKMAALGVIEVKRTGPKGLRIRLLDRRSATMGLQRLWMPLDALA